MTCDTPAPGMKTLDLMAIGLATLALLLSACAPSPDTAATPPTPTAPSALAAPAAPTAVEERAAHRSQPVEMPQVSLPDGFKVTIELAVTPDELAQGLMFRPKLEEDRGMLLIFAEERLPSIWMMNTLVALDIVYLDSNGTVVDVITDAQPCPGEPCPRFSPKQPAKAVLEIPAGGATRHAITDGARLEFLRVPGFPVGQ